MTVGSVSTLVRTAAPVRLDLAGGWTDVSPFAEREGGAVVTLSIALHATVEIRGGGPAIRLVSEDYGVTEEVVAGGVPRGRLGLLHAAVRLLPVGPCTLTTRCEAPPGSGLGSSGAMDVALVAALGAARGEVRSPAELAELGFRLESVEAGIPGGRQDQFSAAFGGCLEMRFGEGVAVRRLKLPGGFAEELERRTVLCYTGASRLSGDTIARVMAAYERGEPRVVGALRALRATAESMSAAMEAGDLTAVGSLMAANWRHQQELDPAMATPEMARLEAAMARAGAVGGKAAGSGAGGSMFFLAGGDRAPLEDAARAGGCTLLPVRITSEGVRAC